MNQLTLTALADTPAVSGIEPAPPRLNVGVLAEPAGRGRDVAVVLGPGSVTIRCHDAAGRLVAGCRRRPSGPALIPSRGTARLTSGLPRSGVYFVRVRRRGSRRGATVGRSAERASRGATDPDPPRVTFSAYQVTSGFAPSAHSDGSSIVRSPGRATARACRGLRQLPPMSQGTHGSPRRP